MQRKSFYSLTAVLVLFVCDGCSDKNRPRDLPRLYPVTLTIMLDDGPLGDAIVSLRAENEVDARWTVSGRTNAVGKAVVVTHGRFAGAPAGKFKVLVTKIEPIGDDAAEPVGLMSDAPATPGRPRVIQHVDPVFGDPNKTPLEIEVSSKGKGTNAVLNVHKPK